MGPGRTRVVKDCMEYLLLQHRVYHPGWYLHFLMASYFKCNNLFPQVIDSTDRERISVSKEELHRMLESDELHKASVLVFANKQDVAGCMSATEISQQLSLQACTIVPLFCINKNTWLPELTKTPVADTGLLWSHRGGVSHRFASSNLTHTCVSPGCIRGWSGLLVKLRGDLMTERTERVWRLGQTSIQIHSGILWCVWKQILVSFHIFPLSNCLEIFTKSVPTHVTKSCSNVMLWDVDHDHCPINNQFNLWAPSVAPQHGACCITSLF